MWQRLAVFIRWGYFALTNMIEHILCDAPSTGRCMVVVFVSLGSMSVCLANQLRMWNYPSRIRLPDPASFRVVRSKGDEQGDQSSWVISQQNIRERSGR